MTKIWQMWSGALPADILDRIENECQRYPSVDRAGLGLRGETTLSEYRTSDIKWINKENEQSSFIADILWSYAKEANRNAFGFDVDYFSEIQYTTYFGSEGGKYEWHHDTFWGNDSKYDRKITVVIQMSDPEDYEGGVFELDGQYEGPNLQDLQRRGTVLVFPSFIPHRVTEVTKGVRKTLITWVEGPKFR